MHCTILYRHPQRDAPARGRWCRRPALPPAAAVLALGFVAVACAVPSEFCEQNPDDLACDETVVSETEIWRLELEQLDDGTTSFYPRRGTITMRLNRTTQPDPTCAGHEAGDSVTTFLADVEAFPTRLQGAATESADGSWNCHGMAATVRLNDGTTYELWSDDGGGGEASPNWLARQEPAAKWSAGARSGRFGLRGSGTWDSWPRESHVDVVARNRTPSTDWDISLQAPKRIFLPLEIVYNDSAPGPRGNRFFETVPAAEEVTFSWPRTVLGEHTQAFSSWNAIWRGPSALLALRSLDSSRWRPTAISLQITASGWSFSSTAISWNVGRGGPAVRVWRRPVPRSSSTRGRKRCWTQ